MSVFGHDGAQGADGLERLQVAPMHGTQTGHPVNDRRVHSRTWRLDKTNKKESSEKEEGENDEEEEPPTRAEEEEEENDDEEKRRHATQSTIGVSAVAFGG